MHDIFISYAREDQKRILPLVEALESKGWSVFWDRRIPAGSTWRDYIGKALKEARCVIVAWSEHSIQSEWVAEEADDARARGALAPLFLDDVLPPIGFRSIQATNLSNWQPGTPNTELDRFIEDLENMFLHKEDSGRSQEQVVQEPKQKPLKGPLSSTGPNRRFVKKRLVPILLVVFVLMAIAVITIQAGALGSAESESDALSGLVFASKIEGDGRAVDPGTTFPADITDLYAVFNGGTPPPGMNIDVSDPQETTYYAYLRASEKASINTLGWRWIFDGKIVNEWESEVEPEKGVWLQYWNYDGDGIFGGQYEPGVYTIVVLIDGNPAMSSKLTIRASEAEADEP